MTDQAPPPYVRTYHPVALAAVAASRWTHVETCGPIVYLRRQADGDWHLTLDDGTAKVVAEIMPTLPLAIPRKGWTIVVRGITRRDTDHMWAEVHPVEAWRRVPSCVGWRKVDR
jgi:hypothetical protein